MDLQIQRLASQAPRPFAACLVSALTLQATAPGLRVNLIAWNYAY